MSCWKNRRTGRYCYEFQYLKKRYTGSGFKTKKACVEAREARKREVKSKPTLTDGDFRIIASAHLDYCERRYTQKTVHYKSLVYRKFSAYHKNPRLSEITPAMVHDYLHATCPTNQNYNKHRKEISALFNFARRKLKVITYNPIWDLDKMPVEEAEKQIPSEEEVLRIITAADPETERPLIAVILHTLARIDEALRLTWEDINFESRTVTLKTRKRRDGSWRSDPVDMNEDLYKVLWALWKKRRQQRWVFYNELTKTRFIRRPKLMRGVCKRAGVQHYGFHALRHFVASYLQDVEKVGTKTVSKLLRHSRVSTTERYLHITERDAQKLALKRLEGKF